LGGWLILWPIFIFLFLKKYFFINIFLKKGLKYSYKFQNKKKKEKLIVYKNLKNYNEPLGFSFFFLNFMKHIFVIEGATLTMGQFEGVSVFFLEK
jgi:hypothetical protein